jgi:acyl carrier protein
VGIVQEPQSVQKVILEIVAELSTSRPQQIKDTDRLREDLGLDSVSSMEMLSMLAERLDLDVSLEEAMQVNTVGEVIALSERRLGKA